MIKVSSFRREADSTAQQRFDVYTLMPAFIFLCLMWFVFWWDAHSSFKFYKLGIYPRSFHGLLGIVFSPLIHGGLKHIGNNSLPILVLGTGLQYFYPKAAWRVLLYTWLGSGLLVWLFARESYHIGASGIIYALVGFLMLSGILRRQPNLMALSFLVVFLYGGLVWGVLPIDESVSHEAHLGGALVGFALAYVYRKEGAPAKRYSWEGEETVQEDNTSIPTQTEEWKRFYAEQNHVNYHYTSRHKEHKQDENTP